MMVKFLVVGLSLVHFAVVIYFINLKDRSALGKGINEDIPENRNYKPLRPCASHRYSHSPRASTRISPFTSRRQAPTFRTGA